ncbi:MAG TPA: FAD-dependent oxidoreductase [Candidatus Dormibacteraeota bacterium]|nr:FAD-dependent oxidoreductase [Candidatus Dormibacteraeota bacterium]
MRVVVDLTRCQGYAQCAFHAPDVFRMYGEEALMYDLNPDDAQRQRVLRAAAACPVRAILVDRLEARDVQENVGARMAAGPNGHRLDWVRRIVVVGASLAGLEAAERLREEGFTGSLTVIGDESGEPYDRPPLSKQVLNGLLAPERTTLPKPRALDVEWRLGQPATGLDLTGKRVRLADGQEVGFDRLLIATGTRARPWPNEAEAALDGVFVIHTQEDAGRLRQRLVSGPQRVLVIGAGFTGSEVASIRRDLGLPVTVVEQGPAPLVSALGGVIGRVAADMQRDHGVDLRCGVTVAALEGDGNGRLRRAYLSDGDMVETDVAVAALGAIRNVEWLEGSGLAAGPFGVACDAGCRAFDANGVVSDDVFVAGDVARFPHALFGYQFLSLEHWGNAVAQAEIAAHNMVSAQTARWPHLSVPVFWSAQFGTNIKSVGVPTTADEMVVAQGSVEDRRFVAVYGREGRVVAAVSFDQAKWLGFYQGLIESAAPFPPPFRTIDQPAARRPVPAEFPGRIPAYHATAVVTGHAPNERRAVLVRPGSDSLP